LSGESAAREPKAGSTLVTVQGLKQDLWAIIKNLPDNVRDGVEIWGVPSKNGKVKKLRGDASFAWGTWRGGPGPVKKGPERAGTESRRRGKWGKSKIHERGKKKDEEKSEFKRSYRDRGVYKRNLDY